LPRTALYPVGNFFPSSWNEVGFQSLAKGDYRLALSSWYKGKGFDLDEPMVGEDPGVEWAEWAHVNSGLPF
jgi:hypothetical protein